MSTISFPSGLCCHFTTLGEGYPDTVQSNVVSDPQTTFEFDVDTISALGMSIN